MINLASSPRPVTLTDRRASQRRDCSFQARIKIAGEPPIPCKVINVSAMGALLQLNVVMGLPPVFKLIVDSEMFEAECEVRHQTGVNVGVLFTSNRLEAMAKFG